MARAMRRSPDSRAKIGRFQLLHHVRREVMSLSRCCCHFHAAAALSGCAGLGQWVEPTMYYAVVTILLYLMHVLSHPRPVDPTVSYFWIDGTCCSLLLT
jgi:hypothetical protein